VDEQTKEKMKEKAGDWLKKFISKAVATGTLSAAALLVSPFIAVFEALGAVEPAHLFLESIIGEELFEKIKEKLGVKKYSEKDIEEIYELARKDEKVRNMLAELVNELIDEKLLDELGKGSLEAISQAVNELKKELPDIKGRLEKLENEIKEIKKRLEKIEEKVEQLVGPRYLRNEDELIEVLKMGWVKGRKPVVSNKLRKKIEKAVECIKEGEKVCIIGDAGIGKTTALYLACLRLMSEGIKLRVSGIEGEGVLVVDDIGAKSDLLKKLENCRTPVIASARKSEWESPRRWNEVEIEPEDQRPKLREMFISMLKANKVKYTEEAVDEIVKRDPTPVFLSIIAEDFKGKEMDIKDVSRIPKDLYEYIAEVIKDCEDDLAIALLYCVAKTETGWLHSTQLNILRDKLSKYFKGDGEYERLLAEFYGSYGIKHDVWRDLITMDRERVPKDVLSSVEEMDVMKRIRAYDVEELTREACKESLNYIKIMKATDSANLAKRVLENFQDLSEDVFRIALGEKGDKRDFILDVIAIEAPDPFMRIEIDKAERLAYGINAPNAEAVLFGRLSSYYGDLASKDKRFLPDLAGTLNNLGAALCEKGMLDDAVERYEEALKIYRDLASKDKRFLPDLAGTLNNLGNALCEKGMLDDAVERYEEALKIYRDLAEKDEKFLPDLAMTLNNLGNALGKKGLLDDAIDRLEEALKVMEPLSDKPWLWNIISESHIGIALLKRDKKGAAEHLCAALKMLTDGRAPKTYDSEKLLKDCISHLKEIPEELIPEECRKKLIDILHRQS